jgi:hypothetical protein
MQGFSNKNEVKAAGRLQNLKILLKYNTKGYRGLQSCFKSIYSGDVPGELLSI